MRRGWHLLAGLLAMPLAAHAAPSGPVAITPHNQAAYTHILPSGRRVAPIGTIAGTPNLPLGVVLAGGRVAVLSGGATASRSLTFYNPATLARTGVLRAFIKPRRRDTLPPHALAGQDFFQGLAAGPDGRLYVAGGASDDVLAIDARPAAPRLLRRYSLSWRPFPASQYPYQYAGRQDRPHLFYPDALALSVDGRQIFVAGLLANAVARIDLASGAVSYLNVGPYPVALALADGGRVLGVALWGANRVALIDTASFRLRGSVAVGPALGPRSTEAGVHPLALAAGPSGRHLYAALANADRVARIDAATGKLEATLSVAPYPGAPPGSYPDALSVVGDRLYVADAGNDDVAVFDRTSGHLLGRLPTGWYPAGLAAGPDALYVVAAKGLSTGANLQGRWIGTLMDGLLQRIALPLAAPALRGATDDALAASGFNAAARARRARHNAVLTAWLHGKVDHVVLILRENKTFDEELGTYPGLGAMADPKLALYHHRELPNLYALAGGGALFTRFDTDGEVTAQGHQWTTAAADSDFVQRTWPAYYSGRGLVANPGWTAPLLPHQPPRALMFADRMDLATLGAWSNPWISYPAGRFLFDDLARHHVPFENFGEFIARDRAGAVRPALASHMAADFPGWGRKILDTDRARVVTGWIGAHEADLPRFLYIWLPDDHTAGATPCYYTPDSYVADNDAATGQVIAALARTKSWRHTLVLVTEDDPQSGADHIDAHRSVLVAYGPWVKRGILAGHPTSQVDMMRTIEAILGVPPLSQWDEGARVIGDIWAARPAADRYHVRPMRVAMHRNKGYCRQAASAGFTPTRLMAISGQEQMRQEWLTARGRAAFRAMRAHLAGLAASRKAPLAAFVPRDDND